VKMPIFVYHAVCVCVCVCFIYCQLSGCILKHFSIELITFSSQLEELSYYYANIFVIVFFILMRVFDMLNYFK
jgi:hypothetical protein